MSPFDPNDVILKGASTDFDPDVVQAFLRAFRFGRWTSARPSLSGRTLGRTLVRPNRLSPPKLFKPPDINAG